MTGESGARACWNKHVNFWTGMSLKIEAFQLANTSLQKRPEHPNVSLDQDSRIGFVVRQSFLWGLRRVLVISVFRALGIGVLA